MTKPTGDHRHPLAETVSAYGARPAPTSHTKLSITLPDPLLEEVRAAAASTGTSVSGVIAAALRSEIDRAAQARLDAAIELQNDENLAWSAGFLPSTARIWSETEW